MKCEKCRADITFRMSLQQAVPFSFRCTRCRTRYRVEAPNLKVIFYGIILVFALILIGLMYVVDLFSPSLFLPYLLSAVAVWMLIEYLTFRYITVHGKFLRLDKDGVMDADTPATTDN